MAPERVLHFSGTQGFTKRRLGRSLSDLGKSTLRKRNERKTPSVALLQVLGEKHISCKVDIGPYLESTRFCHSTALKEATGRLPKDTGKQAQQQTVLKFTDGVKSHEGMLP